MSENYSLSFLFLPYSTTPVTPTLDTPSSAVQRRRLLLSPVLGALVFTRVLVLDLVLSFLPGLVLEPVAGMVSVSRR